MRGESETGWQWKGKARREEADKFGSALQLVELNRPLTHNLPVCLSNQTN